MKEYGTQENQHFCKAIFMPYFKDIFNDLLERSDNKDKGINKASFLSVIFIIVHTQYSTATSQES